LFTQKLENFDKKIAINNQARLIAVNTACRAYFVLSFAHTVGPTTRSYTRWAFLIHETTVSGWP